MKNIGKKGLINVLLTDRKKLLESYSRDVFDIEFFQNYFNEDCERYTRYVMDNNLTKDNEELQELLDSIGCEESYYKVMYEKDHSYVEKYIKELFTYDILDENRFVIDEDDLSNLISPSYLSRILSDEGLYHDWYPDVEQKTIEDVLNDREKSVLVQKMGKDTFDFEDLRETDLMSELENIYSISLRQSYEDEIYNKVMDDLRTFFDTKDIKFDNDHKGNNLLSINVDNFLHGLVSSYYNDEVYHDFSITQDFSSFMDVVKEMMDYHDSYEKINSVNLDYFYPEMKIVEEMFHQYFEEEIG